MKFVELVLGGRKMGVNRSKIAYIVKPAPGGLILKICYHGGSKDVVQSDMNHVNALYKELSEGMIEVKDRNDTIAINPENVNVAVMASNGMMLNIDGHPMHIDFNNVNVDSLKKAYCDLTGTKYVEPVKVPTAEEIAAEKAIAKQKEETQKRLEIERTEAAKNKDERVKGATAQHADKMKKARERKSL